MSRQEEPAEGDDRGQDDVARPGLLSAAEELARSEAPGWRGRSSTVRRPRRVVRGRSGDPSIDDATEPERVRVRSTTEEGARARATPVPDEGAAVSETSGLLDATGQPIDVPDQPAPSDDVGASGGSVRSDPTGGAGAEPRPGDTLDASVFLVDAVRGYLDAVDLHGVDDPITVDRRQRLRRTLELWDRQSE